jgi:hypothetical protein
MAKRNSPGNGIFTKADYEALVRTRRSLNDMITTFDKAEACGVDCAVYRQQNSDLDKQLEMIHTHFMTPPPTY